ncbi:MAG: acyltransferase family protein [Anaerolineales bacterium]|nr:acyltransferase family protein [Anaerolineales bacterium]
MGTKYRADIDGLRAIAVLSVVLGHAGIGLFSGGYIGVDVFFVISGYLITAIIAREIEQNQFSILKFYERRIRRIFPALFAVLGAVCVLSLWLYNSNDLFLFSKSLLATTLFYSNFLFWSQAGYFDAPSLLKPLLHTWSLAVEEQFYIFFPWLLFVLYRYGKSQIKNILILTTALSLALSVYGIYGIDDGNATAFYLLHMRAWELLFGGLIALRVFPAQPAAIGRNFAALAGLLLIGVPVFYYTSETPFPGLTAIPPVLGTGLIIWSGEDNANTPTFIGRLLSIRPIVFIGLISYSLYLWHWPILVFAKYFFIQNLSAPITFLVLLLIFLLSALSWRFIEQPFRFNASFDQKRLYRFAGAAMLTSILFGLVLYKSDGFSAISYFHPLDETLSIPEGCDLRRRPEPGISESDLCNIGIEDGRTASFLAWGDSHARASGYAIHLSAKRMGVAGKLAFTNGCPPLILEGTQNNCYAGNEEIINYLKSHDEIKTVILDARWTLYAKRRKDDLFPGLEETVKRLVDINKSVAIALPSPEMKYDVPPTYFVALRRQLDVNQFAGEATKDYLSENKKFFNFAKSLAEKYSVEIIQPWQVLCGEKICPAVMDGNILYIDKNHISSFAAELTSPLFDPIFTKLKNEIK